LYNEKNGKNGWDLKDLSRLDDNSIKTAGFIEDEVQSAGHNRIPICSDEEAFNN
jgi:hypothetical protein